jgi:hypothetical protein
VGKSPACQGMKKLTFVLLLPIGSWELMEVSAEVSEWAQVLCVSFHLLAFKKD